MIWGFSLAVALFLWALYRRTYRPRPSATEPQAASGCPTGSVYILTNPEYPNLVKIGQTGRTAQERADELSSHTGVPTPFSVEYEFKVPNPEEVEQTVHEALSEHSVNPAREFFKVRVETARHTIEQVVGGPAHRASRSWIAQTLGLALMGLSVGMGLLLLPLPDGHRLLGDVGANVASLASPSTLGYPALLFIGMIAVWGWALQHRRPLRPLLMPSACVLALCPLLSTLAGWLGHALSSPTPVGWGGHTRVFPSELMPWAGSLGLTLADWSRSGIGPSASLLLLSLAAAATCSLALRLHENTALHADS